MAYSPLVKMLAAWKRVHILAQNVMMGAVERGTHFLILVFKVITSKRRLSFSVLLTGILPRISFRNWLVFASVELKRE